MHLEKGRMSNCKESKIYKVWILLKLALYLGYLAVQYSLPHVKPMCMTYSTFGIPLYTI